MGRIELNDSLLLCHVRAREWMVVEAEGLTVIILPHDIYQLQNIIRHVHSMGNNFTYWLRLI